MNASYVLGSTSFTVGGGGTTQSTLLAAADYGGGLAFDSTNELLYVSDVANNRVMVFNVAPSYLSGGTGGVCSSGSHGNGENACYVLGQTIFTSGSANEGGSASQSSLDYPSGLALDSTNQLLYVVDFSNVRVMVFPAYANASWGGNGENALYELGQASGTAFTSTTQAATQSGFESPNGIAFDQANSRLFVGDFNSSNNGRILVFNTASISNGMNASYVLGTPIFTSYGGGATQSTFKTTYGLAYDSTNSYLYVPDAGYNRVMIFDVSNTQPTPSSPTQSGYDGCAIASGQLYCWGYNLYGEAGLGNTTQYKVPQQVGFATNWTAISEGDPTFDEAACGIAGGALLLGSQPVWRTWPRQHHGI
jgi:DNA-binding beta-propeller fold protein YncE